MQNLNQNYNVQQSGSLQQVRFVPVSNNVSYLGNTVTYGLGGTTDVNAFNNQSIVSGNFAMAQQPLWNTGWNNTGYAYNNPSVSANQFGQNTSGNFDFNTGYQNRRNLVVQPSIDISETSSDIVISAFVTNNAMNNINLSVTQDSVTISGSVRNGNEQLILHRTIPLSTSVRAEAVDATIKSGVLDIRLPKTEKMNRNKPTIDHDVTQG